MTVKFTNNASTTVGTGINASATSLTVASASSFPSLSGADDYCYLTIQGATNSTREVVKATALSSNTFTIVRAQDNTSAGTWAAGDVVELRMTAALLTDVIDAATVEGVKTNYQYTPTAGQTVFSGSDNASATMIINQAALVSVYMNGVRLVQGTDYSVSSANNTVTLGIGATTADIIDIEVYGNFVGQSGAAVGITGGSITGTAITATSLGATGTATLNTLVSNNATISGGSLNGVTIGGTTRGAISGNAISGTSFASTGDITISNGNNRFVASSTSSGDYVRMYGGGGTGKWDIYGHGANLRIGDNESAGLVQIDTNLYTVGRVGIGRTPSGGTLHVQTGDAGTVTASTQADDLVIENSAEGGMTIITPDDQSARIRFTSPSTNGDVGGATIFYRQNINKMLVGTAVAGGVLALASGAGNESLVLASNGAATFSSTITTGGNITLGTTSSNQTILQFLSATDGANTIHFGDGASADAYKGYINYNHTADRLELVGSGDITLDAVGDIVLDADGADVIFKDGGTTFLEIDKDGNNARIKNPISDGDVLIQGSDGGSIVTALSLDMENAGAATFSSDVTTGGKLTVGNASIGTSSSFGKLRVEDTGWSSGSPYGTVAYILGGDVNDANWGHLLVSQSGTTTGSGGKISFGANGDNPIAGIKAYYAGATYGHLDFYTRPSGGTSTPRMRINSDGKIDVGGVANQTTAVLNARFNGAAIEFGHGNNSAGYYGTAGSYGNNGHPYIGFSCDGEESVNTFTTRGAKGNIITGDLSGNLTFAQVTTASATGQTPVNRMTLDHAGRFIVGATSAFDSSSFCVDQSGLGQFRRDGTPLIVRRDGSVGALISFEDDGASVGSIGTAAGPVAYIVLNDANSDNVAALKGASGAILPSTNAGADKDGTMNLGSSNARFESLYLSGSVKVDAGQGIFFGGAAGASGMTSQLLDDYEEGTATISLLFSTTNASINQGNTFTGYYTRVGNVCTIIGYTGAKTFATTGAGNPRFSGLPFAGKSGVYAIPHFTHNTFFTNSTAGYVEAGSNYFYPITDNGTGVAAIAGTGTRYIMFSLTYLTA